MANEAVSPEPIVFDAVSGAHRSMFPLVDASNVA
jgi:hypothetical protein